ncbi:MAG: rane protein related to metalloendopeptidase [Microbacteriaceae bacterium]|jgi:murein DD-endopeptidase MepM/ murein hydrolase activator NlpD|nr:rane protein related to metalloendopeptidase [Microbacteriaceae bacterium]
MREKPVTPHLPGLSNRSVRNLGHVQNVRTLRRGAALVSVAFVTILGVTVAVPAYAQVVFQAGQPTLQTLSVSAHVPIAVVSRDAYDVTAPPALTWPVPASTPIASPFGARVAPCDGCSSFHEGADFDAGYGAEIHAIAAGTVVEMDSPGYAALGTHVAIEHVIDGQTIVSAYGHMIAGSMPLQVGDTVYAGEVIGLVGDTGESTGPHLHFEIRLNGTTPTDPVAWMHAHLG